jgi:hemerythrin-like domain-containing protein
MNTTDSKSAASGDAAPLSNFTNCHSGILRRLSALDELPALLEPAARARQIAEQSLEFFREAIFEHHLEEERELFPAVIASAQPGEELTRVKAMTQRLTDEHRRVEALWKTLESGLKRVAKGQSTDLDTADLHRLVTEYKAHASFEEVEFLPLSETILSRNSNHMAALGMSLHMRHVKPVNAYM